MEQLPVDHKIIGLHIKSLANLIRRHLDTSISATGAVAFTGTQGMIVHYLFAHQDEKIFQRDVEAHFHIRRATATRTLQLMEGNWLITRAPDPNDARLKRILLTQKALDGHKAFLQCLRSSEEKLREGISEQELEQFFATLNKMKQNLEDES